MVSLACFRTLSQLVNSDNLAELQQYIANNKNVCIDDKDEVSYISVHYFNFNYLKFHLDLEGIKEGLHERLMANIMMMSKIDIES